MKRVLITGANSYVGTNVEKWLMREPDQYYVETLDMKDPNWKNFDFSKFDVVFHVAGIAHIKETKKNKDLYFKINRDLVSSVAIKAKKSGVIQFIFMSSMSVYGSETGEIDENSLLIPKTNYGKSKKEAEIILNKLSDKDFIISIIRPPMIYGRNCPGNYQKLSSYVKWIPYFPKVKNLRSIIHVYNLSEFIKILINEELSGTYCPQNKEIVSTSDIVKLIAEERGKRILITRLFNFMLILLPKKTKTKLFASLYYNAELSKTEIDYNVLSFKNSISESEGNLK